MLISIKFVYTAVFVGIIDAKICPGMDIRNFPSELDILTDCVVVNGSLQIVLMDHFEYEDFVGYSYPKLREISEYLLLFRVKGLSSLETLFPNLMYIRGRKFFKNGRFTDSVIIYDMPNLVEVMKRDF